MGDGNVAANGVRIIDPSVINESEGVTGYRAKPNRHEGRETTIYKIDLFVSKLPEPLNRMEDWVRVMDGVYVHRTESAAIRAPYDTVIGRTQKNGSGALAKVYATLINPIKSASAYSYRGRTIPLCNLAATVWHGPCPEGYRLVKDGENCTPDNTCWMPIYDTLVAQREVETAVSNAIETMLTGRTRGAAPDENVQHPAEGGILKGFGTKLLEKTKRSAAAQFRDFPFERMEVGDAFPIEKNMAHKVSAFGQWYTNKYAKDKHFVTRTTADGRAFLIRDK